MTSGKAFEAARGGVDQRSGLGHQVRCRLAGRRRGAEAVPGKPSGQGQARKTGHRADHRVGVGGDVDGPGPACTRAPARRRNHPDVGRRHARRGRGLGRRGVPQGARTRRRRKAQPLGKPRSQLIPPLPDHKAKPMTQITKLTVVAGSIPRSFSPITSITRGTSAGSWMNTRESLESTPARHEDLKIYHRFNALIEAHYLEHWLLARYAQQIGVTEARLNDVCRPAVQAPAVVLWQHGQRNLLPALLQGSGLFQPLLQPLRQAYAG